MRQTLADAGCLYDVYAQESSRRYIQGQIAKATEAALDSGTGVLNSNFQIPGDFKTSTPMASPSAPGRRPAPPLRSKPAPSLAWKPASAPGVVPKTHTAPKTPSANSGAKSRFARILPGRNPFLPKEPKTTKKSTPSSSAETVVPDYQDLNVTLSHQKVGAVLVKRIKRDVKDLYSGCKAKLGLDYPQT